MEDFEQLENKEEFRRMLFIIGGIVLVCVIVTAFLLFRKTSKVAVSPDASNTVASSTTSAKPKPLFSPDLSTWKNYYWPGKINTHYPSDWQLKEDTNKDGLIVGLEITPPTGIADDMIFIGGDSAKCSSVLKYSKNECLKNKIQVPFYTNSKNAEVSTALDLIFQNTILTEGQK